MAGKNIGVLFSGGLDSTYLVWKNLEYGNTVVPFYFEIENNGDKVKLEKNRIELLWEAFNSEFKDKIEPITYTIRVHVDNNSDTLHFKQIPIWILGLMYSQKEPLSEIQIGYVMNDDAISHLDDITKIYNCYNKISDPLVPLKFPLSKTSKWKMLDELPENYRNLVVSCEAPRIVGDVNAECLEYEPCGTCIPCTKILATNNHYSSLPKIYKRPQYEQALKIVRDFDKVETKEIDGRHYYMVEIEDVHKVDPAPYQLHLPFEESDDIEKEVEHLKMEHEKN